MKTVLVPFVTCFVLVAGEPYVENGVVPDVLNDVPPATVKVMYNKRILVAHGNELTPTETKDEPSYEWPTEKGALYTLVMSDPDAPSRQNHSCREFVHQTIGNIPGNDISNGTVLYEYIGCGPPKDTGLHRYIFTVFKQPGHINFNQSKVPKTSDKNRCNFKTRKFAAEKGLTGPIAGNFFLAQYDDYVLSINKQLNWTKA